MQSVGQGGVGVPSVEIRYRTRYAIPGFGALAQEVADPDSDDPRRRSDVCGCGYDHPEIPVGSKDRHRRTRERVPASGGRKVDRSRRRRPGDDRHSGSDPPVARYRPPGYPRTQARRAAGIRSGAQWRLIARCIPVGVRSGQRQAQDDPGRAGHGSLLRAAHRIRGRAFARHYHRVSQRGSRACGQGRQRDCRRLHEAAAAGQGRSDAQCKCVSRQRDQAIATDRSGGGCQGR